MRFGAHEHVSPDIKAQTAAYVSHEMIAADIVRAGECAALELWGVEAKTFSADASHHFGGCPCAQFRGLDAIEIAKDWAVRQNSSIEIPAGSPSHISADAEAVLNNEVGTESRIQPATFRNVLAIRQRHGSRWSRQCPEANRGIEFLGVSECRHKKQNA